LVQLEINTLTDIFNFDISYINTPINMFFRNNQYNFVDSLITEEDHELLKKYVENKDLAKLKTLCVNHWKKSEYFRKFCIDLLNNYVLAVGDQLIENAFVKCGHLPNEKKYLEYSNLNVRTLEKYC
jgi:hypothetical protein